MSQPLASINPNHIVSKLLCFPRLELVLARMITMSHQTSSLRTGATMQPQIAPAADKSWLDGAKMTHATYQHLTTLSSGSILLISAFLTREATKGTPPAIIALGSFFICDLLSILLMFDLARKVGGASSTWSEPRIRITRGLVIGFFMLGLFCVAFFAKINFVR